MGKIISANYKDSFPESNILLLFINNEEICCAVAERKTLSFLAYETIPLGGDKSTEETLNTALINSELLSPSNYSNVICCFGYRTSTLVPEVLFDEDKIKEQLSFSFHLETGSEYMTDNMPQIQAVNIFAFPESLHQILSSHFHNIEIHHSSTSTISYLLANKLNYTDTFISVIVHQSYIEIIVTKGSELIFYNTFNYFTDEEFVYYILFVCEQLHLNPETTNIQFSGNILGDESAFVLVSKYLPKSKLAVRPENFNYPNDFRNIPDTFHYYLFSQLICV